MKKTLYSVRDNLTFEFEQPVVFETDLACLRAISSQIVVEKENFEKGTINYDPTLQHATRSIFVVGVFDTSNGVIEPLDEIRLLCVLSDAPNLYQKLLTEFQ